MPYTVRLHAVRVVLAILVASAAFAQAGCPNETSTANQEIGDVLRELQAEVRDLRQAVSELRAESEHYRAETERLRQLINVEFFPASGAGVQTVPAVPVSDQRLATLEEEQGLLQEKINEQYQTKVESVSKYRVRLSGIVLLNAFNNQGVVDSIDIPTMATYRSPLVSGGSVGATLRQSEIGLEGFGPNFAGARTRADLQLDFAGGFPGISNGVTSGLLRMRTASVRLDWQHTSVIAGQDALFLVPHSPTSFASLIVPALAYAGNLWGWIPQIRVEHRLELAGQSGLILQAAVLDPLTGELPATEYNRQPNAGENSRKPGVGARAGWSHRGLGRDFILGAAGYYSKQNWGFDRQVNSWAGMADWQLPLASWLELTGDFYRGSALGAFGGGIGRSVLFNGPPSDPAKLVRPLNSIGGWTQLKVMPAPRIELNAAAGQDNPFAANLRSFANLQSYINPSLSRNRAAFLNFVYRPRSDLLLSAEFRRLRTFEINNDSQTANHVNLAMGFLF
jgi:hypothetical protein